MAAEKVDCPLCDKKYTRNGLTFHVVSAHPEALKYNGAEQAKEIANLKEEVSHLADKAADVASLKEELAEATAEVSDQDRFEELVGDINSLTKDGKARLAESVPGWTYQAPELAPEVEEKTTEVVTDTPPARNIRFVVKTK